jgi:high-affinity iron transporter
MIKIALVVFRECVEIALMLSIVMAITKKIEKSRIYIIAGIMLGIISASLFAFFARAVSLSFGGIGDEIVDSTVILITVVMIIWTITWMHGYGEKVERDINDLSTRIYNNSTSHFMLATFVAAIIFREGVEIILIVYGITVREAITIDNYLLGFCLGAISGLMLGVIIYLGLVKFAGKYVFQISSTVLMLVAAGLSAEAAGILTSSGIVTILSDQIWDSSWLIEDNSISGNILKVIAGYYSKPNELQVIFYIITICTINILWIIKTKSQKSQK